MEECIIIVLKFVNNKGLISYFNIVLLILLFFAISIGFVYESASSASQKRVFSFLEYNVWQDMRCLDTIEHFNKRALPEKFPASYSTCTIHKSTKPNEYVITRANIINVSSLISVKMIYFNYINGRCYITKRRVRIYDRDTYDSLEREPVIA